MAVIKKDLFDRTASSYVLGCLMRKPELLQDDRFVLAQTDFYDTMQQIVFSAVFNMCQTGAATISPQDVDIYLKQYDKQYEVYKANKGYEYTLQCYQTTEQNDQSKFEYFYNRLKKFSILRDLEANGIDTTQFYNTENVLDSEEENEKLNKIETGELTRRIEAILTEIQNRHIGKDSDVQKSSEGIRKLVEELKSCPEVGLPLDGNIITDATRGARFGKLYTYSAPSGAGKTRYMVGNACAITMPYIGKDGKVVLRGNNIDKGGDYERAVFITTEQKADEIQTMILAYVSGVNEKNILLGQYSPEQWDRMQKAVEIIEKYGDNLIIDCIPDPSIALVKARLSKYALVEDRKFIFYDYIFSSPGLLGEFKDIGVREDVALMMLSNTLKEVAANYGAFIQSATQLNDGWSKKEIGPRDQNCLRGSKAIADKIDVGLIGVKISMAEREQIDAIWKELQKQAPTKYLQEPNVVVDIYKNRRGDLNNVKVFRYFDYGTCHCEDLFVLSADYKSLQAEKGIDALTRTGVEHLEFTQRPFDFLDLKTRGIL